MEESYISRTSGIKMKDKIGYAFGDLASCLVFGLTTNILNKFCTDVLEISVLSVMIMTIVARIWDAINDPIWGRIIDAAPARADGRYRRWLKIFALPVAIASILMFLNVKGFSMTWRTVWIYFTYILFGMVYTCINIPYGSMAHVITSDDRERSALSVFRSIGSVIGGLPAMLLASFCYVKVMENGQPVLNEFGEPEKQMDPMRILIFVCVIAALAVLCFFLCYRWSKERVESKPVPREKGAARKVVKTLLKSRPFMTVSIASMLFLAAQMFQTGYNTYLFDYYFEAHKMYILAAVCQYLPVAFVMFFASKLGNKLGRRNVCSYGILFASAAYFLLFVLSLLGIGTKNVWLYLAANLLGGIGTAFIFLLNWALVADAIDFNRARKGVNDEATSYAFFTFVRKLGQTVATVLINVPLLLIGYEGSKLKTELLRADPAKLQTMYNYSVLIPAVLFLLVFFILRFAYPLSKKRVEELQVEKEKFLREENAA